MAVRTKQLAFYRHPTPGNAFFGAIYTCPPGHRTIVKEIVASWGSVTGDVWQLALTFRNGPTKFTLLYYERGSSGAPEFEWVQIERWAVMHEGDFLSGFLSFTGPGTTTEHLQILVSGTELEL